MRLHLAALLFLVACSSGSDDVPVVGLWKTQVSVTTVCRVFCADGLTLETFGDDTSCTDWFRPEGRLACFPYSVDGDRLSIDGSTSDPISLSEDGPQLTWESTSEPLVYTRLSDTAAVCDQPCYYGGNEDQPLRE